MINLTTDQQADPLYIMTHNPANANRACVHKFLSAEATCGSVIVSGVNNAIQNPAARSAAANWASFPYRSTGSKITDWEAFYGSLGLGPNQPFLCTVFTLLLLGVS
jgi:hypothetical protein